MADRIIVGLRAQPQANDTRPEVPGDTGNEGDDEEVVPGVNLGKKKRKGRGSRPPLENRLSVCVSSILHVPDFLLIAV